MKPTRILALAALIAASPLAAEENTPAFDPEKMDAPGALHENDIQLAEYEMLAFPYADLVNQAEDAAASGKTESRRWQAYVGLLRSPAAKHEAEYYGHLTTRRDNETVDACNDGDLPCLSAFWSEKPEVEKWISPSMANGALVVGVSGQVATEAFALAAGTLTLPGLVVSGVAVGGFVMFWKMTEGMSPEEEAARYGRDIDALLGRTWIQRNLNSYRYTFEGILRMAWSLRDAEDGVVRQLARRILLLEGASNMSQNCPVSLAAMWDAGEACGPTVVARHMAFRSWLGILGYLNQRKHWGLDIKGTVEEGKLFRKYFPSLGQNQPAPTGLQQGPSFLGIPTFG